MNSNEAKLFLGVNILILEPLFSVPLEVVLASQQMCENRTLTYPGEVRRMKSKWYKDSLKWTL